MNMEQHTVYCRRAAGHRHRARQFTASRPRATSVPHCQQRAQVYSTDATTKTQYEEQEYEATKQAAERKVWAANVRSATNRKHHIVWEPELNPPALLSSVCVVLVGPKKPISCGTVARACSCFECEDIRIVQARCDHNTRSSRSVSKGAQYVLHRAQVHTDLSAALADVDLSVAFTRWLSNRQHKSLPDIPSLLQHPLVQRMLQQPQDPFIQQAVQPLHWQHNKHGQHLQLHGVKLQRQQPSMQQQKQQDHAHNHQQQAVQQQPAIALQRTLEQQQQQQQQHLLQGQHLANPLATAVLPGSNSITQRTVRIALVFGREEFGLSDGEVEACNVACAISVGRLQESLSLSHAVSVVLAQLYQARLSALAAGAGMTPNALPYSVSIVDELAEGYDASMGVEH